MTPSYHVRPTLIAWFAGFLGSIVPLGCALQADSTPGVDQARQQAGCGAVGYSHFGCPEDYVCKPDGQCVQFDENAHLAFRFSARSEPEAPQTPQPDASVAAYIDVATSHLRTSVGEQAPLLESLGMQVQRLDKKALATLAQTYATYDAKLQALDEISVQVASQLEDIDPDHSLHTCQQLFEDHDFVQPVTVSDTRQRMDQCVHTYGRVLVALEIANSNLSSFDSLVFARMRTTLGHMQEALGSGLGSHVSARAIRIRELPNSLRSIAEEVFGGLSTAQLLFPIVRLEVSVDTGMAVLAHRVGYFAQLAASNLSERLPAGTDALEIFHHALSAAVGEMKRNEEALSKKLSEPWSTQDAWQLVPVIENAGLLSHHPELLDVHAMLREQLAHKENWQPVVNGVAAVICLAGGAAAFFSVIGAPAAFVLCAPATVLGVVTWIQLRQVSANALMLAFFGPEQGLMPAARAQDAARQTRWAGSFVALDFLGVTADVVTALRAVQSLQDVLHLGRLRNGDAFFVHARTLPPLTASGIADTPLAQAIQNPNVTAFFEQPGYVPWSRQVNPIQYGFELETNSEALATLYRPSGFNDEAWQALGFEDQMAALRTAHAADGQLSRLGSAPDFLPRWAVTDVGTFELNGFAPVQTLADLRQLQWSTTTPLVVPARNPIPNIAYFHTHVSFPWTPDAAAQQVLARYWVLWNEMATFDLYRSPDTVGNFYMGPVSRSALNHQLAAFAQGPTATYNKWHFLGLRSSSLYGDATQRIGFEVRAGGHVSELTGPDNQIMYAMSTSAFLQNPTSSTVRLAPGQSRHTISALDDALWDMPGPEAFERIPVAMQTYIRSAIEPLIDNYRWRAAKLESNISMPMVGWHTRAFLSHKQAEILAARQAFLAEMEGIIQSIDVTTSPNEARRAVYQAVAHWAQRLNLANLY